MRAYHAPRTGALIDALAVRLRPFRRSQTVASATTFRGGDGTKGERMPLFMDVHQKAPEGAKAKDVAAAHEADVKTQGKYGVQYLRYWFDEKNRKIFCLVDAPNAEAAKRVHREAHGLEADEIYPVTEGS